MAIGYYSGGLDIGGTKVQVHDVRVPHGIEKYKESAGGIAYTSFIGVKKQMITFVAKTYNVSALISGFFSSALWANATAGYFLLNKGAHAGLNASGSVHHKCSFTKACLVLDRVRANGDNEMVEAEFTVHICFDGTNAPLVIVDNVAAETSGYLTAATVLRLLTLNATDYEVNGFDLACNTTVDPKYANGAVYPTDIFIRSHQPVTTVNSNDMALHTAIGISGGSFDDTVIELQALTNEGTRTATTAESHTTITVASGMATPDTITGPWRTLGDGSYMIEGIWDGSNLPVALATGVALEVA